MGRLLRFYSQNNYLWHKLLLLKNNVIQLKLQSSKLQVVSSNTITCTIIFKVDGFKGPFYKIIVEELIRSNIEASVCSYVVVICGSLQGALSKKV